MASSIHKFEAFQFLSRRIPAAAELPELKTSPGGRLDLRFRMQLSVEPKAFDLSFAQWWGGNPTPGVWQVTDPDVDKFLTSRWPTCVSMRGQVEIPFETTDHDLRKLLLEYVRVVLWADREPMNAALSDQSAVKLGYRREWLNSQIFDITGMRRPSPNNTWVPTEIFEPIGPGVVTFREWNAAAGEANELAWSSILQFSNRTTFDQDKPAILRNLGALRKHYNSNSELEDAKRHAANGDIKAAVRSGAPAVEAIYQYYRESWGLPKPPQNLSFDQKIDSTLQQAGRPIDL